VVLIACGTSPISRRSRAAAKSSVFGSRGQPAIRQLLIESLILP
jgi:hypothetical protein